jgi:WD40 repeat protein
VAFSPDHKRLITGGSDHLAKVWDVETGRELLTLRHPDAVDCADFSRDGRFILTGCSDHTVHLWNAKTGHSLFVLKGHTTGIGSVGFSPNGKRIVTTGYDGQVKIWDTATGQELLSLAKSTGKASFSADGFSLLTLGTTINVWDGHPRMMPAKGTYSRGH